MIFERRLGAFRHRHYGDAVYIGSAIALAALEWVDGGVLDLAVRTAAAVVMAVGLVRQKQHARGPLCEECIKGMPLNAGEQAQDQRRWRWTLAAFHYAYGTDRRLAVTGTVALVLLAAGSAPLYLYFVSSIPPVLAHASMSVMAAMCGASTWAERTHNRFEPWCPYCRGNGEGADDTEPGPGPQSGHGRPLTA